MIERAYGTTAASLALRINLIMNNFIKRFATTAGCAVIFVGTANANSITFNTTTGPNAEAVFVTSANQLTVTLRNLQADPQSVAECISALVFGVSEGTSVGLISGSGVERSIASGGSFSDGSAVAAGWVLSGSVSSLTLNVLSGTGHAGPAHTIIGGPAGSGDYDSANGSIANNGPHNPFLAGDVVFILNIPGLTSDGIIENVFFQFGTADGANRVPGRPGIPSVPDGGSTVALLGAALTGLYFLRMKKS
jgi:hypothetical protein